MDRHLREQLLGSATALLFCPRPKPDILLPVPRPSYHHILISLIAAIGLMQMTLFIGYVIVRSLQKVELMAQEKQAIETLEAEIIGLRELRSRAQNDPIFLMDLARCQGFLDRGETALVDQSKVGKEQLAPCAPKQLLPKLQ